MRPRSKSLNRIVKTNLKYQTKEFFSNSTLHGVRYVAEKGRSFSEKFMWFSFVTIGAVAAFVIIASLWEKFQTNPTITGLDTDFHNQQLDFPTVTVCPIMPYNHTSVNQTAYQNVGNYMSDDDVNIPVLEILTKLSYDNMREAASLVMKIDNATRIRWSKQTLRYWTFKIVDVCESVIESCKFRANEQPCCDEFKPVYSERGYCFSFNTRYYGTEDTEEKLENFQRISETDKSWSLQVQLKKESKVYLHSVDEVFSYDYRPQFAWEPDNSIDILISMKQTYTTEDAKQLTIAQRKCIFPDSSDYTITYYKDDKYSLSACMKECRMNNAQKLCGCIPPFYAPVAIKNYKYCEIKDLSCLSLHAMNITNIGKCSSCELSCLNTVYDIEKTSQISANEKSDAKETRINIEFLTWPIIRYKREVLFGWVDLLVSFGGIAGLFLGFSLLSGIEIIYYFTVRASCMMYKNREELYKVQEEEDTRPFTTYDLNLWPEFKRSRRQQLTNIQMVIPVAYDNESTLASSNAAIVRESVVNDSKRSVIPMMMKKIKSRQDTSTNVKINTHLWNNRAKRSMNELQPNYSDKQIPTQANRMFQQFSIAPYITNIKPLDRNYRRSRSQEPDLVYHGYLP